MFRIAFLLVIFQIVAVSHAEGGDMADGAELGVTIMGAIIQKNLDDNVALIKEQNGVVKAVKKGHAVQEKYIVTLVQGDHIEVVAQDGKKYRIKSDKFAGAPQIRPGNSSNILSSVSDSYREDGFERSNGKIAMTAAYRDKLVKEDLAKVLMQATAEPYIENGQIMGFRMSQIDEDSIYAKAGLSNGDIVSAINGQELNSVGGTITLLQSLKNADNAEVEIRRGSKTIKFNVEIR